MSEPHTLCAVLRSTAGRFRGWSYSGDADPDPRVLMREAADEIERLRRQIDGCPVCSQVVPGPSWRKRLRRG